MDNPSTSPAGPTRIDGLLERTRAGIAARKRFPESTYRLQFNAGFTFRDGEAIVPYLADLGITHCYASPYLKARRGSIHGYDIVDFSMLNPEIGSTADHEALVAALRRHDMGHILDIVPNHMAVATNDNAWWNDVLENGPAARHAETFDIAWRASPRASLRDKVLLPILGEPYGDALEAGKIRIVFENGVFNVHVGDRRFPVSIHTYGKILGIGTEALEVAIGLNSPALAEFHAVVDALNRFAEHAEIPAEQRIERSRAQEAIRRRLASLVAGEPNLREFVERNLVFINGKPGNPYSFDLLDDFLEHQFYRLSYWRVAAEEINYRRFFDVTNLAALGMEREEVFVAVHDFVLRLIAEGKIDGVRVDHPDGLYDPRHYFLHLQERFVLACARLEFDADSAKFGGDWDQTRRELLNRLRVAESEKRDRPSSRPLYVIAEKILGAEEALIETWAIHGTSGYDFLNVINGLFVDAANEGEFSRLYQELIGDGADFQEIVYRDKCKIAGTILASEMNMLAHQFDGLAQKSRQSRDFTFDTLRRALQDVIACFQVYRSYIDDEEGVHDADRADIDVALRLAAARNPRVSRRVWDFTRSMLLLEFPDTFNAEDRDEQRRFVGKFQQVTAPVTAKGIEDTAFYVYTRLTSLNEVGGDPGRFGVELDTFHAYNAHRRASWPHALSALSTHDTKRSEDVRARLNVLSEIPKDWRDRVEHWMTLNDSRRENAGAPDRNEEYLLYQTLIGAWPLEPIPADETEVFVKRIQAYMLKAMREAKVQTSWLDPDSDHEQAVRTFIDRLLDERENQAFLEDFKPFQRRISHYGLFNSLSQTLLKLALPGVPDTYQGTEIWDFSLVDPDNRRQVDYDRRMRLLADLKAAESSIAARRHEFAEELTTRKEDGRIKLYVHQRVLRARREHPGLLSSGEYLPLVVEGIKRDHIVSFARRDGDLWAIAAIPRLMTKLDLDDGRAPLGEAIWRDTRVSLDSGCSRLRWRDVFTDKMLNPAELNGEFSLRASDLFRHFPIALLIGERKA